MAFEPKIIVLEGYWYKMSDRGMVTYNAPLGVLSIWHYHSGEVDSKRTVRCIQQLSKCKKLIQIGYKYICKVKNSDYLEPWHDDN